MAKWRGPFIWNSIQAIKSNFSDGYQFGDFTAGWYGFDRNPVEQKTYDQGVEILGQVKDDARQEFLEDREHTEAREDSAYQRAVADMRKAGLNPYTISSSGVASSSQSNVGESTIATKIQMLGYLLDLQNLDTKNRSVANNMIGSVLKVIAKS